MSGSIKVLVDSSSPAIRYVGDWIQAAPTDDMKDPTLFSGTLLSDKLYGSPEGKKVSLFYNFTGAVNLRVQATVNAPRADPAIWENFCAVEPVGPMVAIETFTVNWAQENDYMLCDIRNLSPTEKYTLNFTADVKHGQPVWFDKLILEPTARTDLSNALVQMDHRHLSIHYDGQWEVPGNAAHITSKPQSKMSLNFTGTSVSWYSVWGKQWGTGVSQATWSIDNGPQQPFTIPAISPSYENLYINDLLFKATGLEPAPHHLAVTYAGSGQTTERPLGLSYLVIQNAAVPTGTPSPSGAAVTNQTPAATLDAALETSRLSQGAKIGVGVGVSIAGLLIIGAIVLVLLRRRRPNTIKEAHPVGLARDASLDSSEKKA